LRFALLKPGSDNGDFYFSFGQVLVLDRAKDHFCLRIYFARHYLGRFFDLGQADV
jgi:hypothetical protein